MSILRPKFITTSFSSKKKKRKKGTQEILKIDGATKENLPETENSKKEENKPVNEQLSIEKDSSENKTDS